MTSKTLIITAWIKRGTYLLLAFFQAYIIQAQNVDSEDSSLAIEIVEQNTYIEHQYQKLHSAQLIYTDKPIEALQLVEDVLVYSIEKQKAIKTKKGINKRFVQELDLLRGEAYHILGNFNFQKELYNQAVKNYLSAYQSYTKSGEENIPYELRRKISTAYKRNKSYQKSLGHYLSFESKAFDNKRFKDVVFAKNEIGELYYILNNISLAESYHLEALELAIKHHDYNGVQASNRALEQLESKIKEHDNLTEFQKKKEDISNAFNRKNLEEREYEMTDNQVENLKTKDYRDSIRKLNQEVEERQLQIETTGFSDEHNRKNEINRQILELREEIFEATNEKTYPELSKSLLKLHKLYQKIGKPYLALETYKAYQAVQDSIHNIDIQKKTIPQIGTDFNEELKLVQSKLSYLEKEKDLDIKTIEVLKQQQALDREVIKREKERSIFLMVGLGLLLIVIILFVRLNRSRKRANELLRLKGLQAQMNPHFIFNTLNSVNNFISKNDERSANRYISDFSRLMRHVLELAQEDLISLEQEIEMLSLYLKLEQLRFKDKFTYIVEVDDSLEVQEISIPPMLIQPFIENAIWHGLRYIETDGKLVVNFKDDNQYCLITIEDNGIGREKSAELKTKNQKSHNSTALKNIESRLSYIKRIYKKNLELDIVDKPEGKGTIVYIKLFK